MWAGRSSHDTHPARTPPPPPAPLLPLMRACAACQVEIKGFLPGRTIFCGNVVGDLVSATASATVAVHYIVLHHHALVTRVYVRALAASG
jgi:hypothetical protein